MIQRPCYGWIIHALPVWSYIVLGYPNLYCYYVWYYLTLIPFHSYCFWWLWSFHHWQLHWYTTTRHWTRKWCRPSNLRAVDSPIFWHGLQLSNGTTLHSLFTSEQVKFAGFGFMDDVDMVATDNLHQALLLNSQQLKNLELDSKYLVGITCQKVTGPLLTSTGKMDTGNTDLNMSSWALCLWMMYLVTTYLWTN